MSTKKFTGVYTPIVTPFKADETLDEQGLRSNVSRWMTTPLAGLVVLGSNGEAPQLEDAEADRVIDIVRGEVPKARPMIVGTGRESTKATIAATRRAAQLGADIALVRTPSFFKLQMTTAAFVRHYTEVADASPIPVFLYNVTMYTGVNMLPDAVATLAQHPNIGGMKESGSDIVQIGDYVARTPDDFVILAGSAASLFAALCAGVDGAILALAALAPDACVELYRLVENGRIDEARALQQRLLPLARAIGDAQRGVPGLKAALNLMGYAGGVPRSPLRPLAAADTEGIRTQLDALGLLEPVAR
jgi:4-hydroxy-2-oxoglutarate aldolase